MQEVITETPTAPPLIVTDFDALPLNLTVSECAAYTRRSPRTIYQLIADRKIPYCKPKGSNVVTFNKHEVRDWLEGRASRT